MGGDFFDVVLDIAATGNVITSNIAAIGNVTARTNYRAAGY